MGARDAEARGLDGELEAIRRNSFPGFPALGLLSAVEGRVDLDRRHRPRGIFELFGLGQFGWIEGTAPRRVGPSADADADLHAHQFRFGMTRRCTVPCSVETVS